MSAPGGVPKPGGSGPAFAASATGKPLFDSTNRVFRVLDRLLAYRKLAWHTWRSGASAANLLRTQFPFLLRDATTPPMVTVEFTNICNLKCAYCTSPLGLRPRGYMTEETFQGLLRSVRELCVERVRVVGNGEPTLHPDFPRFARALGSAAAHLSVLSNGQWKNPEIPRALLDAVSLIELTVGGDDPQSYAANRIGGSLERVLANLRGLREQRAVRRGRNLIGLRVNLRPSDLPRKTRILRFWKQHADVVYPQYVSYRTAIGNTSDVFLNPHHERVAYPRCSLTLKDIGVEWTGTIPLCSGSASQLGPPGHVLGNVRDTTIASIWCGTEMQTYRTAHRRRDESRMPICKGCSQGV